MQLIPTGDEIWTYEGSKVSFYGFPFPTRMTVVRLSSGMLWLHSPEKLNPQLKQELAALGEVGYLVSPNKLHHLFLQEWIAAYPAAKRYSAPGLANKRKDIEFHAALLQQPENEWKQDISQTIFKGSPAMQEVVFYHRLSKTLILTDLIENFNPATLNWWQRGVARFAGILYPTGKMPVDWRLTFYLGSRAKARASLKQILSWDFENVILSHGECVNGKGREFVTESFSWLMHSDCSEVPTVGGVNDKH